MLTEQLVLQANTQKKVKVFSPRMPVMINAHINNGLNDLLKLQGDMDNFGAEDESHLGTSQSPMGLSHNFESRLEARNDTNQGSTRVFDYG